MSTRVILGNIRYRRFGTGPAISCRTLNCGNARISALHRLLPWFALAVTQKNYVFHSPGRPLCCPSSPRADRVSVATSACFPCAFLRRCACGKCNSSTRHRVAYTGAFERVRQSRSEQGAPSSVGHCHMADMKQRKLSSTASFSKDLGLDSLDSVEVVMAVEEVN